MLSRPYRRLAQAEAGCWCRDHHDGHDGELKMRKCSFDGILADLVFNSGTSLLETSKKLKVKKMKMLRRRMGRATRLKPMARQVSSRSSCPKTSHRLVTPVQYPNAMKMQLLPLEDYPHPQCTHHLIIQSTTLTKSSADKPPVKKKRKTFADAVKEDAANGEEGEEEDEEDEEAGDDDDAEDEDAEDEGTADISAPAKETVKATKGAAAAAEEAEPETAAAGGEED